MARILVVDEEPLIHQLVVASFEDEEHEVVGCATLDQALEAVAQPTDLLLLHRGHPEGGSRELVRRARQWGESAVVLLSSQDDVESERERVRLGATAVLYKPLDPVPLRALLEKHLAQSAMAHEIPESPRVLVVDDDPLVRVSVVDVLGDHGYRVQGVESASTALELLGQEPFEIVLTDVMMEGLSGLDLIRSLPEVRPQTHALVMTGYASKDLAISALRYGAHDLLEKPLTPDVVRRAVDRTWRLQRTELENQRLLRELQTTNHDLEVAKEAAEAASRVKSEFLTNMSHEVRTPLNGVLGCLSLLETGSLDDRQRLQVQTARRAGEELLTLLTDVLDFANLQSSEMTVATLVVDPREVVTSAIDRFASRLEAAGIELELEVDPQVPGRILAHGEGLQRVLGLLLDNARKFARGGRVRVEVDVVDGRLRIVVADSGPGIDPEEGERVFQPFYQVDGSHTRRADGAGLGLALGRRLIESQGGTLDLESGAGGESKSSRFVVQLPLRLPASAEE